MSNENNVAAQAGDEPMDYTEQLRVAVETVCEGWTLPPGARKTLETALWSPQVSPRATADVERNLRAELINEGALRQYCHNDGSAGFVTAYDFDITNRFLAAIATTKPGA